MKKIKFINKILTLSLIGGGILTSLPFIMTSCSKAISKISILSISVDEDDTLEGNINHASHQAGHIQVISSDHADHEYLYNIVDADPMLENKIHIVKDIESGNWYIKWDQINTTGDYKFKIKASLRSDSSVFSYSDEITLKIGNEVTPTFGVWGNLNEGAEIRFSDLDTVDWDDITISDATWEKSTPTTEQPTNWKFIKTGYWDDTVEEEHVAINVVDRTNPMDCPVKLSDDNTIAFYHLKLINTSDNFYTLGSGTLDRNGFNGTYNTSWGTKLVLPNKIKTTSQSNGLLTSINQRAMVFNSSLTGKLIIPNGVTNIGGYAFGGCYNFTGDLVIPNSVTTIGESAFRYLSNLTGVIIPSSVTSLDDYAFIECSKIDKLTFDNFVSSPSWSGIQIFLFWKSTGTVSVTGSYTTSWTAQNALDYAKTKSLPAGWITI